MPCFGQTTSGGSQTLQALLAEIRLLRQDLRATNVAAQRSQILIYRLQGEEAAVARTSQRLDEARDKVARTQDSRKHLAAELKQNEDFVSNTENPSTQRKAFENRLPALKAMFESIDTEEQQNQSREIDAEQRLRAEEARLSDLRDQLERLDKALENAGHQTDGMTTR